MLTLLFLSLFAFSSELTLSDPDCACVKEVADPFEEPAKYNYGRHKGRCIDSCRFRPAQILNRSANNIQVANVLHFGVFYQTQIDLNNVQSVEAGFENFTPGVNHVVLKFNMKKLMHLTEQAESSKPVQFQTQSLIVSAEGVPGKGFNYSLFEGFQGEYLIVTRVLTAEEYQRWTQKLKNPVSFYPLSVNTDQARKSFEKAMMTSFENGLGEKYQLLTNNCSSKAYSFLGHKNLHELSIFQKISLVLPVEGPVSTRQFLVSEKLIPASDPREPVASPELN